MSQKSFYRRELPPHCIAFSSAEGREIFTSALQSNGLKSFFVLVEQHSTQSEPAYCGPSTLVVVLNALAVDPRRTWKGPWRWYDESMLNCCIDFEEVKQTGITLPTFLCLAICQGLEVEGHLGSESSADRFRDAVKEACVGECPPRKILVVSYCRKVVGQTGCGHFSPVAAYDEATDSVLVLDTARFKYFAHWIPLKLLFSALQPLDPDTNKSRGYVLLSYDGNSTASLPMSILFRSKKSKSYLWTNFKSFLQNRSGQLSLEEVASFWTENESELQHLPTLLSPQFLPNDTEVQNRVDFVLLLLNKLVTKHSTLQNLRAKEKQKENDRKCCSHSQCNASKIQIGAAETIFIIYLATLCSDPRKKVLDSFFNDQDMDNKLKSAMDQIIDEAELVKLAIEMA